MKKIITLITGLFLSAIIYAQNLDTVSVSLTLRAQDWAWLVGKHGAGNDSTERVAIRNLRAAVLVANPATWTTNVTINGVKGRIVIWMYNAFCSAGFQEVINMGSTTAERTTIYTTIRNINNSAIQYYIGVIDANFTNQFINNRQSGKSILMDN
jgi:hypothetical protein